MPTDLFPCIDSRAAATTASAVAAVQRVEPHVHVSVAVHAEIGHHERSLRHQRQRLQLGMSLSLRLGLGLELAALRVEEAVQQGVARAKRGGRRAGARSQPPVSRLQRQRQRVRVRVGVGVGLRVRAGTSAGRGRGRSQAACSVHAAAVTGPRSTSSFATERARIRGRSWREN